MARRQAAAASRSCRHCALPRLPDHFHQRPLGQRLEVRRERRHLHRARAGAAKADAHGKELVPEVPEPALLLVRYVDGDKEKKIA